MNTVKSIIISLAIKFMSVDFIAQTLAWCIAKLINYASKTGGSSWTKVKNVMKNTENWIKLFNDVYEDDEMTPDEEKKVADAIAGMTTVNKVTKIITGKI